MVCFAIWLILLLLGVVPAPPTSPSSSPVAITWSLLVFAIAGVAMIVANKRSAGRVENFDGSTT